MHRMTAMEKNRNWQVMAGCGRLPPRSKVPKGDVRFDGARGHKSSGRDCRKFTGCSARPDWLAGWLARFYWNGWP